MTTQLNQSAFTSAIQKHNQKKKYHVMHELLIFINSQRPNQHPSPLPQTKEGKQNLLSTQNRATRPGVNHSPTPAHLTRGGPRYQPHKSSRSHAMRQKLPDPERLINRSPAPARPMRGRPWIATAYLSDSMPCGGRAHMAQKPDSYYETDNP